MEVGYEDEGKNNFDAHAFLDTFYNCAAADNRYKTYTNDIIQSYHDVLNNGRLLTTCQNKMSIAC